MKLGQFFKKVAGGSMIVAALACPVFTSCYDDSMLVERIEGVEGDVEDLKTRVQDLEEKLNTELAALQTLLENKIKALQGEVDGLEGTVGGLKDKVDGLVTVSKLEKQNDGSHKVTLSDGNSFVVYPEYEADHTGLVTTTEIDGGLYWAIYEDGKPVVVTDEEGNPVPVIGFTPQVDVDPATGDVYVTFDGEEWINVGNTTPCVFSGAEVVYTDNYTDEEEATGWYEETPMYVTVSLPDGSTITVTIDGAASFIFGGHMGGLVSSQYIASGTTLDVAFMTTNIVDWIKEVPAGWNVVEVGVENAMYGGASFRITAPTAEAIAAKTAVEAGLIKVVAVAEGGKTVTASLKVTTKAIERFEAGKGKLTVEMNKGAYGYIVGISEVDGYDPAAIKAELKPVVEEIIESMWGSYPAWDDYEAKYNGTTLDDNTFTGSINDYAIDELASTVEMELGGEYIIWALAVNEWTDADYNFGYSVGDIIDMKYVNSSITLETTVLAFNDIQISAEFKGISAFYGGFSEKYSDGDNRAELVAEINAYGSYYTPVMVNDEFVEGWKDGVYTGDPNTLVDGYQKIQPGTTYYLYMLPYVEGKTNYSVSDLYYFEWTTAELEAGSTIAVTVGEPTLDYKKVTVPVSAEDAVYIYYYFVDPSLVSTIADKQAYLLESGYMVEGSESDLNKTGLNPGQTVTLLAMAVDQNGCYGDVLVKEFTSKAMTYASATVTAEFVGTPSQTGKVKFSCDAEVDTYYYWYKSTTHFSWGASYYGTTAESASSYIALTPNSYYMNKVAAADLPAEGVEMTGLTVGEAHYFVVAAKLTTGEYTKAVMLSFTPEMNLGNIVYATDDNGAENAAWVAAKPTVNAEVSTVGDFTTVSWSVELPEGFTGITACFHKDYLTDYPSAKSKIQYILTSEYIGSAPVVAGEVYVNNYASSGYDIYTVVCDAEGNYYEPYVTELNITGGFGM